MRLTRRGRLVLVLGFLTLALALMVPFGGWVAATLTGGSPEPVRIVEVHSGDTLYGIAGDLAKPGHVREMVTASRSSTRSRVARSRRARSSPSPAAESSALPEGTSGNDVTTTHSTRVVSTGEELGWDRTPVPPHSHVCAPGCGWWRRGTSY